MCPRSPMTRTRSSPCMNSKTVVPSPWERFAFPSLRIVAIRMAALNFSVTMSRRTEGFAREGLYLTIWRWMLRCDGRSRARLPPGHAHAGYRVAVRKNARRSEPAAPRGSAASMIAETTAMPAIP